MSKVIKILENRKTWDVYYLWCWGNESEFVKSFNTKKEAQKYIRTIGKRFDGFEGYEEFGPMVHVLKDDGSEPFFMCCDCSSCHDTCKLAQFLKENKTCS
jgi:hypothetical protein